MQSTAINRYELIVQSYAYWTSKATNEFRQTSDIENMDSDVGQEIVCALIRYLSTSTFHSLN